MLSTKGREGLCFDKNIIYTIQTSCAPPCNQSLRVKQSLLYICTYRKTIKGRTSRDFFWGCRLDRTLIQLQKSFCGKFHNLGSWSGRDGEEKHPCSCWSIWNQNRTPSKAVQSQRLWSRNRIGPFIPPPPPPGTRGCTSLVSFPLTELWKWLIESRSSSTPGTSPCLLSLQIGPLSPFSVSGEIFSITGKECEWQLCWFPSMLVEWALGGLSYQVSFTGSRRTIDAADTYLSSRLSLPVSAGFWSQEVKRLWAGLKLWVRPGMLNKGCSVLR